MPDYMDAPLGVPGNPLEGSPNDQLIPREAKRLLKKAKEPLETWRPNQLENPGITNTGGMASKGQPEIMTVPEPVSALDPAYSMHPMVKMYLNALSQNPGTTADPTGARNPWAMLGADWYNPKTLRMTQLLTALGMPGLDIPHMTQGESIGR